MNGLEGRARRVGERAVVRLRGRVATVLRERFGDAVREDVAGVTIVGRGVGRRMLRDPTLRWIAGMLK